ncbi:MAG TPA: DUF885 domain-containing protein [Ideonella sp.]|uniref:DUF885 domain-containing protein n=1 Tax=Ideonella sp. TaxID=1929293 RepID=UPI002E37B08E|nr:DUF885 domain-containing protein [Ideonella sp.]HEX5688309.1 DUF885 domain-containing protein [Ideonella sp.]
MPTDLSHNAPLPIHRRHALALTAGAAWAGLGSGCAMFAAPAPQDFDTWADGFAADWVRLSPERATFTQYFDGAEQAALDSRLTPQTHAHRAQVRNTARAGLARLARYDFGRLTPDQRTGAVTMRWSLQRTLDAEPFEDHNFLFNQFGGLQIRLVSLFNEAQPLRRPADVGPFVERLAQVDLRIDQAIERVRDAAVRGLLPPRFILERSRTQVQDFLAPPADKNLFVEALARRSAQVEGLAPADRTTAIANATRLVEQRIRPAWQRLLALMNELHPRTSDDAGLWRLPDGAAAYAQALAGATTTTLDAEAIHAIGLREVARIEGEMDRVLRALGRASGSVEERMKALRLELQPPAEPDPRPGLIERFKAMVADNQRRSQALFNLQPKAPVEVRREPALTEKTAAAHYSTPAPDGSRPGVFWAPLPGPVFNIPGMRSLAVHEAIPGHHFQLTIQQERDDLPRWRQRLVFGGGSAYSEGWALYAERLAIDHGWYEGDPHQLLGALDSQLFRARRLVVDTGLHAKRWTRGQAIAFGISAQEVERYVVNPGQACAYMIGMLRLLDLRGQAQQAMGERFSARSFHDVVLKTGSVPLDVLGEVVGRWSGAV